MFALLDVKSGYSFLDGTMSVKEIVLTAKKYGYQAVAINDVNNMHAFIEFFTLATQNNIHPLCSLRVKINDGNQITYLLYAKNNDGLMALMELSTKLESNGYVATYDDIVKYSDDLVVIVYGEGGIIENNRIDSNEYLNLYKNTLKDFYIGISNNNSNKWKVDNDNLKLACHALNIKTVALPKVEFNSKDDVEVKRLFVAMKNNRSFNDHQNYVNEKNHFMSLESIKQYYSEDDINNTIEIANKCNINFKTIEKATLPVFDNPLNVSSAEYLNSLCIKGLKLRLTNNVSRVYIERLKYELDVINSMDYADYFLIVYDAILFARKQNIYVGPGRGSSAGSLVAYVLGITHIDPIANDLLFERFLNPERISLPDIDIDFPDDRRQEVIDYISNKYGNDHVAQIVTYGTFAARQALRDVGKALSIPGYKLDRLSKMINGVKATLKSTYDNDTQFKKLIEEDNNSKILYRLARKIEGLPRHTSLHAAGIVMSKNPLVKHVPLTEISEKEYATQYSMNYLEQLGLNKIDFLGLKNLAIIAEVASSIENFDILKIPLDDKKTFDLLKKGETKGIFQLESYGMTNVIKDIEPEKYTDIVAAIALYRPGPVKNIPTYLENRKNVENIVYIHPDLKPILAETYGIIVYQEQIMQIVQLMANFSLGKADIMRKAMSKKEASLLNSMREEFILNSIKNGYSKKVAQAVYDLIEEFSNYGFNKAHSYAYGLIAYQMAYLKANHYLEFYLALLNGVIGSASKTNEYMLESRRANINIFKPNVNYSQVKYIKSDSSILFPLTSIKGVGMAVANKIITERRNGLFTDFFDFVARVNVIGISQAVIEALIYSGALDGFDLNRTTMINSLDQALMYANLVKVDSEVATLDFDIVSKPKIFKFESDRFNELEKEKEYLGFYLSTHPILEFKNSRNYKGDNISILKQRKNTRNLLVYISKIKLHRTKYGDMMAFIEVVDELDSIDIVVMPNVLKLVADSIKVNQYITVAGKIERNDSMLVSKLFIEQ